MSAKRVVKEEKPIVVQNYHDYIIRINPFYYLHVKDTNTNLVKVVVGPKTHTCLDHEKVVFGPEKMIIIPPRHYVIIKNPVITKDDSKSARGRVVVLDEHGQPLLRHGDTEIRFEQPPFPLYDGETAGPVQPLQFVEENTALRLRAIRDFEDRFADGKKRRAGEEWLFCGRATYYPQIEVEIVTTVKGTVLKSSQALKVKAVDDCIDYQGKPRSAGEEWLVKVEGSYLPAVNEQEVEIIIGHVLTYKNALHLRAKSTFEDAKGVEHKAGTEWLVSFKDTELYIPDVHEEITKTVELITLGPHDYCIIRDPVGDDGKPKLGSRKIVRGRKSFFLQPAETIEANQKSVMLGSEDALWLTAKERFIDTHNQRNVERKPGQEWMVYGPGEYWPTLEAQIKSRSKAFVAIEPIGLYIFSLMYPLLFVLLLSVFIYYYYM